MPFRPLLTFPLLVAALTVPGPARSLQDPGPPAPGLAHTGVLPAALARLVRVPEVERIELVPDSPAGFGIDLEGTPAQGPSLLFDEKAADPPVRGSHELADRATSPLRIAPADSAVCVWVRGRVSGVARVLLEVLDPSWRASVEAAIAVTGKYEDLDAVFAYFDTALADRLLLVLRADDYPHDPEGPSAAGGGPVFAATLVAWTKDVLPIEDLRDALGTRGAAIGLVSPGQGSGYMSYRNAGHDTYEFWSPAVRGTGVLATMFAGGHAYLTNRPEMLVHVHRSFTRGAASGHPSLADMPGVQAVAAEVAADTDVFLWIDPAAARTDLRPAAEKLARSTLEAVRSWAPGHAELSRAGEEDLRNVALGLTLDRGRFRARLRVNMPLESSRDR